MSFRDDYDFDLLVNEAEELVFNELEEQLNDKKYDNICKCQDCLLDMATLALNNVKPIYRSSLTGKIFSQQFHEGKYMDEVKKTVKDSIKKISSNPAHDIEG